MSILWLAFFTRCLSKNLLPTCSFYPRIHNNQGLGEKGLVLDSAEFLDLKTKKWTKTSSLKVGRTEHVMSLVYGIPTVIGGNILKLKTWNFLKCFFSIKFQKSWIIWND